MTEQDLAPANSAWKGYSLAERDRRWGAVRATARALREQSVELGAGHRDLLVGAGRGLVLGALVGARLELLRRLPQRPGELREPGRAEQQEHDGEDDDQLRHANAHLSSLQASARRSTSSGLTTANDRAPAPTIRVDTPSAAQPATWSRTSSTVPTRWPFLHSSRSRSATPAGR